MKTINDVCLGRIDFSKNGNDIVFDIWNTYDGSFIGKIFCSDVVFFEINNDLGEEDFFGSYIALIKIINEGSLVMESGELSIKVECSLVSFDSSLCPV